MAVRLVMAKRKTKKVDGREMEKGGRGGTDGVLSVSLWFGFFLFIFCGLSLGWGSFRLATKAQERCAAFCQETA